MKSAGKDVAEIPADCIEVYLEKLLMKGDPSGVKIIDPALTRYPHHIIEQTIEMNLLLHIAFVDNDKVCDSSDKESLWKLMRNYRVLKKVLSLIKTTQRDMTCKVHEGKLTHLE